MNWLSTLLLVVKYFGEVSAFVNSLENTPEEKRAQKIAAIRAASSQCDETQGDTSGYEKVIRS